MGERAASNTSGTLQTNTNTKKKSEDHIRKSKNSEEKLSCSLWREFSLRGCCSSESEIRCPIDSKYCDKFHNCSCQRKHKAKTKKLYFNYFFSFCHTHKKGAPRSHLRYATSAPQTSLSCDLWHPLPAQPMTASFTGWCSPHLLPMAFLLMQMCKTHTHTYTHLCASLKEQSN